MSGLTLGAGYHITYGYDTNGRFETLAWNAAGQSGSGTYSYVPDANLLQGFATASGVQTTYGYEPQRNLKTSVQNRFNGSTISQYDYVYDPLGRRSSAANTGSAFAQAAFSRYGYNDRSELINAGRYLGADINDTADPVTAEQRAYLYDPMGNRTRAEAAAAPVDYLTNELNQYTDIGGALPVYDDDGNMTATPDGRVYTYNAENRLIAAQPQTPAQGDTRTEYVYDYMGRRVQKIVSTWQTDHWSPITEHLYLYDGWNLIKETTAPAGQSAVDTYYVWGLDLSQSLQGAGGVGGLVASVQGSLTYHYLCDANGNVGQVIDAADGSIAAHYEYDPYGNLVNQSGAFADENPYLFSTKYFDSETSLYYYGYRYYSAELGRWISRDPISEEGGLNLYIFCTNRPTVSIDILGRNPADVILKERGMQIPKAEGFSAGALMALALPNNIQNYIGTIIGLQAGIYFFPDSCELAAFNIKAGIFREDNKEVERGNYIITDDRVDSFAMFEDPSNPPQPPNPMDSVFIDDKLKKDLIEQLPDGIGEGGIYSGIGASIEYAEFKGNTTPGSANAMSFKGIFHTLMVGTPKGGGGAYVGAEKWSNGNWVGLTIGLYGPSNGVVSVDWDYKFISKIKLDTNPIGKCICNELIRRVH